MSDSGLGTLVTYNPTAITPNTTLDEVVHLLDTMGYHHWPVVDDGRRVIGIMSDVDLVRAVSARCTAAVVAAVGDKRPLEADDNFVEKFMSRDVVTVQESSSPKEALAKLLDHRVHSLPVVEEGCLTGMITSTDFLREFSYGQTGASRTPVSRCLVKAVETIDADTTIDQAKQAMDAADAHYLPAVQGECPLGVISRRDLRKAKCRQAIEEMLDREEPQPAMRVSQLIDTAPLIRPGKRVGQAACLMVEHGVQAIAVVNQATRLLGILSEDDVLSVILHEMAPSAAMR